MKLRLWLGGRVSLWRAAWGRNFRQVIAGGKENLSFLGLLRRPQDGPFSCEDLEKPHVEGLCYSRK
jgi:hypothetical protein